MRLASELLGDIRFAGRALRRSPGYSLVVLATLALGIGANTAIFSVVNAVLLRPLPYADGERLVMVFRTVPRFGFARSVVSYPDFADWREQATSFSSLTAYGRATATFQGDEGAERWEGYRTTADLIPMLGVRPEIGRAFTTEDDHPGAQPVIVLSYATWQARFGGDSGVVGRVISLDGEPHTVLGVMPADFAFPSSATEFWVPLRGDPERMERDSNFLTVIGRLAPGVTAGIAQQQMAELAARIDAAPGGNEGFGVFVEPRHAFVVRNARTALLVFSGAVALVLVIACANVANLMLARGTTRHREIAVRTALGAGRGRLMRQLLTESTVLAVLGGSLGLTIAVALLRILMLVAPGELPRMGEVGIDATVLGFTALLALGCGITFGTLPALMGSRADLHESLKEGGQTSGLGRVGRGVQRSFVVAQVALAMVLSVGAGLLVNSFVRLTSVEPGYDPENVVVARVTPPRPEPPALRPGVTREEMMAAMAGVMQARARFFDALADNVASLPGVQRAALAYGLPFGFHSFSRVLVPEGMPVDETEEPVVDGNVVTPTYFEALGIPLLRGRGFTEADAAESPLVAVINETMAELFWPGENSIGNRMRIGDGERPWTTVVGVAADIHRRSLAEDARPTYYRPFAQATWPDGMFVVVRTRTPPNEIVTAVRRAVWALDPRLPLTDVAVATDLINASVSAPRFRTVVLGTFGAFALGLALVGIYSVIAYMVGDRTREIGIRMALGAGRVSILRMVVRSGVGLATIGIVLGVGGGLAVTRFLGGMLYGLTPHDPATFVVGAFLLIAVSGVACYVPARRAARINPLESLRYE